MITQETTTTTQDSKVSIDAYASELIIYCIISLSLHAVGGGQDDGGVAGEQRGAAAVPALVTPEHRDVPRDLALPRLAPWRRE